LGCAGIADFGIGIYHHEVLAMTTHFEVTVTLPPEPVENLVRQIWNKEFALPERNYRQEYEFGYKQVERQVRQYIETLDLTEQIVACARAQMHNAVEYAVEQALKDFTKQKAREMIKSGKLLGEIT
jgi:hypothetical protein